MNLNKVTYLFWAYNAVWVTLFFYIHRMNKNTNRLLEEIEILKTELNKKNSTSENEAKS